MKKIEEIKNMLETEYHKGQVKDMPIIDWRQALEHIKYLLFRLEKLEGAIDKHKNKKQYTLHNGKLYISEFDKELYKVREES